MDETKTHSALLDLDRAYGHAPIGLCCLDLELRYVHINEWLAGVNGLSVAEHLGRTIGEVLPEVAAGIEPQLRSVIPTGEPIIAGRTTGAPRTVHVPAPGSAPGGRASPSAASDRGPAGDHSFEVPSPARGARRLRGITANGAPPPP